MKEFASAYDTSKYYSAENLKQTTKFRIKDFTEEPFENDGKSVTKLVLWFTRGDKGLPLIQTNRRILIDAFGDRIAGWKNKVITVVPTPTTYRGKPATGLRVHIPPQQQTVAAPQQPQAAAAPQQPPVTTAPQQPVTSGNGAAAPAAAPVAAAVPLAVVAAAAPLAVAALAAVDPEIEPDPVKPIGEEMDDEVPY